MTIPTASKFSPLAIVRDHYATYYSYRTKRTSRGDYLGSILVPLAVMVLASAFGFSPSNTTSLLLGIAMATTIVLTALVSTVFVPNTLAAIDRRFGRGPERSQRCILLKELLANVSYTGLTAIGSIIIIFIAASSSGITKSYSSDIAIALSVHTLMILMMVFKRHYLMTQSSIVTVMTGGASDEPPGPG